MFLNANEWLRPSHCPPTACGPAPPPPALSCRELYRSLSHTDPGHAARAAGKDFIDRELDRLESLPCELPEAPQHLDAWLEDSSQAVHRHYSNYLAQRKAGAPRSFFGNRSHALHFLRSVAPTKLVDGAWLYGLVQHWKNPRFSDLVQTYTEELGEGVADKNHVLIYRQLLTRHGLDPLDDLVDGLYRQGLIQLALGYNAEAFLPEIIGFNLAYEQLPLHLLITAYELNELGLDPWYFTLHVTVDNAGTGHARRACSALTDTLPRTSDGGKFWQRVRAGSKLAGAGTGTSQVIAGFDINAEVLRIFSRKATAGSGAHSDYCKIAGRSVNEWLSAPGQLPGFLQALQQAGWIRRGEPPANSRFWLLLQGPRPEMFGVFSSYELQVIHDWIRGDASADGLAWDERPTAQGRRPSFRATRRQAQSAREDGTANPPALLDSDLAHLKRQLQATEGEARMQLLVEAMSPARHWTPSGLHATALFLQQTRGA